MFVTIRGTDVEVDVDTGTLSLGDAEIVEKICGAALKDVDYSRATASIALIYVAGRKRFPDLKVPEVRDLPLTAIQGVTEAAAEAVAAIDDVPAEDVVVDPPAPVDSDAAPPTA